MMKEWGTETEKESGRRDGGGGGGGEGPELHPSARGLIASEEVEAQAVEGEDEGFGDGNAAVLEATREEVRIVGFAKSSKPTRIDCREEPRRNQEYLICLRKRQSVVREEH